MTSYLGTPATRVVPGPLPSPRSLAWWALFLALTAPQAQAFSWDVSGWRADVRSWEEPERRGHFIEEDPRPEVVPAPPKPPKAERPPKVPKAERPPRPPKAERRR